MANPVASQPGAAATVATENKGLLDQIVEQGRFGSEAAARERGKDLVQGIRLPGAGRLDDRRQRRGDDDQCAYRANRSSALDPVERDHASSFVPEAGRIAGAE